MKKLLFVAVIFAAALVSCKSAKNIKAYSEKDSVAYAIAVGFGEDIKRFDSTLNASVLAQAIADALRGNPKMTREEANEFLNEYFMVRLPAKNKAEGEAFLEEVKAKNPNVKVTESGLMYEIIDEGDMAVRATQDADQVQVNYRGTLKDGTEFDKGDSIKIALNRVVKGWTEGMKLVGKGGKITLWVPADLGYGARGQGQIQPNSVLVFDIDLLDVIPAEPVEPAK